MPRADNISAARHQEQSGADADQSARRQGRGEAGCVGAMPAVANAIVDALSLYGIRHIEMPATPERVWRAIRQANGG